LRTKPRTSIKNQVRIPDDWNGQDYCYYVLRIPKSTLWVSAVSGAIYTLTRGRFWDGSTGIISNAQLVGLQIWETCGMICGDNIADAIRYLADSLDSGGRSDCCDIPAGTGGTFQEGSESEPASFGQPDDRYPTQEAYLDDKCKVANAMYEDLLYVFQQLNLYSVPQLVALGGTTGSAAIAALFVGSMVPIVLGLAVLSSIVALLVSQIAINLDHIISIITTKKNEIVCAMYDAPDADTAQTDLLDQFSGEGLNVLEQGLIDLIVYNNWLNQLFTTPQDLVDREIVSPVDCATACASGGCEWLFETTIAPWSWVDVGNAGYTSVVAWNSPNQSLRATHTMTGGGGTSRQHSTVNPPSCFATGNSRIVVEDSGPSDGIIMSWELRVSYLSAPAEVFSVPHTTALTSVHDLVANDQITEIRVLTGRTGGPASVFTVDVFEVRIEEQP